MNDFRVLPAARVEIAQIGLFGEQTWGRAGSDDYILAMLETFEALAVNPKIGKAIEQATHPFRWFRYGSHVIIYLPRENGVDIYSVKHGKSEWIKKFLAFIS